MRRIGKAVAATTLALGGMFLAASPAMATELVDIKVGDITLYNDIDVDTAAALCGIVDVNALVADLNEGDNEADCLGINGAKVVQNH